MIGAGGKKKFAADAGLRRALQALSRTIPEQVRAFKASGRYARPEPRGWLESMLWSHAIPEKDAALVRSVANYYIPRTTKGRQLAFMQQLQKWRLDNTHLGSKRGRYLRSEALRESRERDLVKQMASGFHPPRANEYVIPASISGEFVVDASRGRSPFLFRGGEMAKDWRLATRHPDVAAAYATSRAGSHGTTSGIMKVLRRDRLVNAGEAAADSGTLTKILKTNERGLSKLRNLERKTSNYEQLDTRYRTFGPAGHRGHSAGTYEAVVKPKPGRNPVVGEYRVRPVRLPDGTPGYGLTTLSGVPAPKVFSLVK